MVDAPYQLGPQFWRPVLSRIKIMSAIDIRYSPLPQDGKFPMKVGGVDYDIRVATATTIYGEKAVLRVQKKDADVPTLETLGFQPNERGLINELLASDHGMLIICGPTGSGKSLGPGTPVLKYDGTVVPVEEIKKGDLIMGPDSKPRTVTGTASGTRPMYEIVPTKGDTWVCNDVHMMTLKRSVKGQKWKTDGRKRNDGEYQAFGKYFQGGRKKRTEPPQEIVDVQLDEFLSRTRAGMSPGQYWKLFKTGVEFPENKKAKETKVDHFYQTGLWLGDGTKSLNEITTGDEEIRGWVAEYAARHGYPHESKPIKGRKHLTRERIALRENGKELEITTILQECIPHKLGNWTEKCRLAEKRIPQWMLTGSRQQRLALLAGLLDSDGSLDTKCFDISLAGRALMEQVRFLAGSLGLAAEWRRPRVVKGKEYPRLGIYGETSMIPNLVERKKAKRRKQRKDPLKTGWVAKPLGRGEYFGFELNGDGRFLLGDFTVTHNTKTLSAVMYMIDRQIWNVITAENPVEIRIPKVEQTAIDGQQMTFAKFVPGALRQDPDYIMIGETRDKETTEEVIRASITGHIVMTTLHTNSAAGCPARLIDMGGEPFLITDSLKVVIAQRLIRRLCGNCCRPARGGPTEAELREYGVDPAWLEGTEGLLEPVGCAVCSGTGYSGRIAIAEGYGMSSEIRRIILKENADTEKIRREMIAQGGKTLLQGAVELAARRVTSLQEALAIRDVETK
jgi:hypothetical protein